LGKIAPGVAEFWASTGAIYWEMLLAEALVIYFFASDHKGSYAVRIQAHIKIYTRNRVKIIKAANIVLNTTPNETVSDRQHFCFPVV